MVFGRDEAILGSFSSNGYCNLKMAQTATPPPRATRCAHLELRRRTPRDPRDCSSSPRSLPRPGGRRKRHETQRNGPGRNQRNYQAHDKVRVFFLADSDPTGHVQSRSVATGLPRAPCLLRKDAAPLAARPRARRGEVPGARRRVKKLKSGGFERGPFSTRQTQPPQGRATSAPGLRDPRTMLVEDPPV